MCIQCSNFLSLFVSRGLFFLFFFVLYSVRRQTLPSGVEVAERDWNTPLKVPKGQFPVKYTRTVLAAGAKGCLSPASFSDREINIKAELARRHTAGGGKNPVGINDYRVLWRFVD